MPELKPCPCQSCKLRKYYAHAFDVHIFGVDCPYQCEMYDNWNRRAGEEDKRE